MNASSPTHHAPPEPTRERWQPLRIGLVELYHYDYEEFHFRDGRLLLRGNNGTGKSKVLSLALPFLFDAQLSPSRVEPDGDRNKRMDWNLLMGHYQQRIGYTWIEFGRLDAGEPRYLTLGCGLRAISGRPRVDAWYFTTHQRVGDTLNLVSKERVVATREKLIEALGVDGQVWPNATAYRRQVDEALFGLGPRGYEALVETLILLRQPQLSKRPNEGVLSGVLTNALPTISAEVLDDVADAFAQLESYRDEVLAIERLRAAIDAFTRRYARYASVRSRREARRLRQAQTAFDGASRALATEREAHARAERAMGDALERVARGEVELRRAHAALQTLREDPLTRSAQRLHDLEHLADEHRANHEQARARARTASTRAEDERRETEHRQAQAKNATEQEGAAAAAVRSDAERAGVLDQHEAESKSIVQADAGTLDPGQASRALGAVASRRRAQVSALRARLAACDEAEAAHQHANREHELRREIAGDAEEKAGEASRALREAAAALVRDWAHWVRSLSTLVLADPPGMHADLEQWVETLDGPNPAKRALDVAYARAAHLLAADRSALATVIEALRTEDSTLSEERSRLVAGEDPVPPAPHTRAPESREDRPGAPLWQLVDFHDAVTATARAGLEAALQASGLLDAWVTPDGAVLKPETHDVWLIARGPREVSLRDWLVADADADVAPGIVDSLLASIAVGDEDVPDAECWISPAGGFRIGGLTGAWEKPAAEFVGYRAREAARARRVQAIDLRREAIADELAAGARDAEDLDVRAQAIEHEREQAPDEDDLRRADAELSGAERSRRVARDRLDASEIALREAEERTRAARAELELAASDLALPPEPAALADVERAIGDYQRTAERWVHALGVAAGARAELDRQRARQEAAQAEHETAEIDARARFVAAEETTARLDALRDSVGLSVAEHEARMRTAERAIDSGREALDRDRDTSDKARVEHARTVERVEQNRVIRDQCAETRQRAVEKLQGFTATGLLAIAVPDLELPAPGSDWAADPALQVARRTEQALSQVPADDSDWDRVRGRVTQDYTELQNQLSGQGYRAHAEDTDFGLIVAVVYHGREERPDILGERLAEEVAERRAVLTEREREVLENHLESEVAVHLQRLMQGARDRVIAINGELARRPTSTGVRFRLKWEAHPPGAETSASQSLSHVRATLIDRDADAWSETDRKQVGAFLHERIAQEAAADEAATLREQLERGLDYRQWHEFKVERYQDGAWRSLAGPASSGERALGLTVPLFAAASSHYESAGRGDAPRLVLLDEAFAGIDDAARAQCMALVREFDLDLVMTSEREWGCYAELPGIAIAHLIRREGIDAVHLSRWTWDGRVRERAAEPGRPFETQAQGTLV